MKLHYHPMSPYSRKAYAALLHRGDAFEPALIRLGEGALSRPEFLALSPFGKMPVLETDDGPIIESTSIIEYLEERGPRLLLPAGTERVARHFDRLGDNYLTAPMAALWWEPESDLATRAPELAKKSWSLFEKQLVGRPFVAGAAFTLGDLGAAIATDYLTRLGVEPPPVIASWRARCFDLPAMARALDEAAVFFQPVLARRRAAHAT